MILKRALKLLAKTVLAAMTSVLLLNLFCYYYSYTGVHTHSVDGATDYVWAPYQIKSDMNEGFAHFRSDENGYTNLTFEENIDILLMGSSHMESCHTSIEHNVGSYLNSLLPDKYTYNIGMGGHQIYHIARNLENALERYHPSEYIIIETDRVLLDRDSMMQTLNRNYPLIPSYDNGTLYYLQKYCPAVKTIYKNIQDWSSMEVNSHASHTNSLDDEYHNLVDKFVRYIAESAKAHGGERIIVFYHPETNIDSEGRLIKDGNSVAASIFSDACRQNDIIFVNFENYFEKLYEEEHILAHGFINSAVGAGHLNAYGQKLIAEKLAEIISQMQ